MQALRSIQPYLQLEKLYVLGTNCTDNGPRQVRRGRARVLRAAALLACMAGSKAQPSLTGVVMGVEVASCCSMVCMVCMVCMRVKPCVSCLLAPGLQGLDKFLKAASSDPDTVLHYEFMQASKGLPGSHLQAVHTCKFCRCCMLSTCGQVKGCLVHTCKRCRYCMLSLCRQAKGCLVHSCRRCTCCMLRLCGQVVQGAPVPRPRATPPS